jgi:hypothetical protein
MNPSAVGAENLCCKIYGTELQMEMKTKKEYFYTIRWNKTVAY